MISRFLSIALGILLLVASGMKLIPLFNGSSLWGLLTVTVAVWEIVLGIWLIGGIRPNLSWLASLITLGGFAGSQAIWLSQGQKSCGCLGAVEPQTGVLLAVVVGFLFAMLIWPPNQGQDSVWVATISFKGLQGVLGVGRILCLLSVGAFAVFGSLDRALAYLRGDPLFHSPGVLEFEGEAGESCSRLLTLANQQKHPVRVVGGTSDCSCLASVDLPVVLHPGESRSIRVVLQLPERGEIRRKLLFQLDHDGMRTMSVSVIGRVK